MTYKVNKLELRQVKALRAGQESWQRPDVTDRAIVTFDLDCDLRGVFNWNVKQLFVYVTARYATPTNPFNEVVIWDRVVNKTSDARMKLRDVFNKYPLIDQGRGLLNTPVTLALNWDVMPITGLLYMNRVAKSTVRMPSVYCTEAECKPEPMALADLERSGGAVVADTTHPSSAQAAAASQGTVSVEVPVGGPDVRAG